MKSKAKPTKGSARTKRFDVGGTVGALAGLGTLAYLMSRKKKGAAGTEGAEYKPQGKFPQEQAHETATPKREEYVAADADENKAKKDALSGGMQYKKPEGSAAAEEKTTEPGIYGPYIPKFVRDKKKAAASTTTSAAKSTTGQDSSTTTGVDAGIAAGERQNKLQDKQQKVLNQIRSQTHKVGTGQRPRKSTKTSGNVPSNTFITKERSEAANASVGRARREQAAALGNSVKEFFTGKPASGRGIRKTDADKKMASGGSVSSASKRADGIAQRGKTRGKVC